MFSEDAFQMMMLLNQVSLARETELLELLSPSPWRIFAERAEPAEPELHFLVPDHRSERARRLPLPH